MRDGEKEKAILRFLRIAPNYTNERISQIFRFAPERIDQLRAQIDTENQKAGMSSVRA